MTDTSAADRRVPGATGSFLATLVAFGAFGLVSGGWQVLLADLRLALSLSPGQLGAALTAGFVGALPAMIVGGRLSDRFGPAGLVGTTGVGMGVVLLGVSWVAGVDAVAGVGAYWGFVALSVCFFANSGAYDVGINAAAIGVEQAASGRVMSYFHAAFSGSAALGALGVGGALSVGAPFRLLYVALGVAVAAVAAGLLVAGSLPAGTSGADGEADGGSADAPDGTPSADGGTPDRSLFRHPTVLLVAFVVCLGFFSEGTMENWSAIYLRGSLDLAAGLGAAGVAAFHIAMFAGRLGGAQAVRRRSSRAVLRAAGGVGAAGMALALATGVVPVVLVGFALVGLSMSVVAPLGFSLAGDAAPERAGEASSVVTFVGYGAFLFGPVLVGTLADVAGLRLAMATVVLACLAIVALAGRVPEGSGTAG